MKRCSANINRNVRRVAQANAGVCALAVTAMLANVKWRRHALQLKKML